MTRILGQVFAQVGIAGILEGIGDGLGRIEIDCCAADTEREQQYQWQSLQGTKPVVLRLGQCALLFIIIPLL